jgi:PAS domain-containing protein
MIRRLPAPHSDALPSDVRRGLIESVFADFQSLVYGGVITSLTGIIITVLTRNLALALATVAMVGVTAARLKLTREYHVRLQTNELVDVDTLERAYLLGTCAFLLSIGFLAFAALYTTDDPFILIAACSTAIIHALSIAVRNFAVQYGVRLQIAVVAIPLAAGFVIKGGLFPLNVVMLVLPLCMFVHGSAARLREILLSQIAFRTESEKIAGQFDFAINNMSHGMCMLSAQKRILVSNAKFSEFLALERERSISNIRFESVMRLAKRRAGVPQGPSANS